MRNKVLIILTLAAIISAVYPSLTAIAQAKSKVLKESDIKWRQTNSSLGRKSPQISTLWGNSQDKQKFSGILLKLPAGFSGKISSGGAELHAVVIKGNPKYQTSGKKVFIALEPASYFSSEGEHTHKISAQNNQESIIYIQTKGELKVSR